MAVSQIWGVKSSPVETLKYIARFDKSDDGALVFSSLCSNDPKLANLQMTAHRRRYSKDKGILLHHGFVSFKKNEISKEKAYEFAQAFMENHFKGYQYFGSVHVDAEHVHFNFAVNAVGLNGMKYYGNKMGVIEMRAEVDRCCEEFRLSVVIPKGKGMSYKEWLESKRNNSWKVVIKSDIDTAIQIADSFEHFLEIMRSDGYYVKHGENVKHILFKKKGMERGSRGKTLGAEYTEQAIKDRIRFKEFNFIPLSEFRKPGKKLKPIEKELMRMYYRRPTLTNNVAMGIHLLNAYMTGERYKIMRYTPAKKKKIHMKYNSEIQKLEQQIRFCHQNNIKSREDLDQQIEDIRQQIILNASSNLSNKLEEYYALEESLDKIRDRNIIDKVQREVEKDEAVPEKKER